MRRRFLTVERLERVALDALRGGYGAFAHNERGQQRRVFNLKVEISCEQPYAFELHARHSATHGKRKQPLIIRGEARCRKCEACVSYRQWQWRTRALEEMSRHKSTLMVTLTMRPEEHARVKARVTANLLRQGRKMSDLSANEQAAELALGFGALITDWIKRVRKGTEGRKPKFRYLLVHEMHEGGGANDGAPHAHLLLHTNDLNALIQGSPGSTNGEWYRTKRGEDRAADHAWLRQQWSFGWLRAAICTTHEGSAHYVCKYITKAAVNRVRGSLRYGLTPDSEKHSESETSVSKLIVENDRPHAGEAPKQRARF